MKTYYSFFFLLALLFGMSSCDNDNNDDSSTSEKTMIVNYKQQMGFDAVHNIERAYLLIKFDKNATKWISISGISGFTYEEGYTYMIKVREKVLKEPLQDQAKISYEFIELISKTKATEE